MVTTRAEPAPRPRGGGLAPAVAGDSTNRTGARTMTMRCPKCGGTDLRVEASVICELTYDNDEPTLGEALSEFGWDETSIVLCASEDGDCDYEGIASEFMPERKGS